ncbi:MAG: branched-chain amino acid ABC transporter permease [Hyphomicrobiales bacterium]|nr:MAG: branched-chain amino acid ABC transporter permease [Hyphomicrobiales bacterium]
MFQQTTARTIILFAALAGLAIYAATGGYFSREIVIEIAILAILAVSLDVCAGFGGMVSLCHGAIMGISAYVYAILTAKFGLPNLPSAVAAVAAASVFGTLVGWITGRTSGIYFIMATLAFGQMAYTIVFKSRWLGGDDGMGGIARFDFSFLGIDLNDSLTFALYALLLVAGVYFAAAWVLRSAFGRTLTGIHSNEDRMRALGINTVFHRGRAFGFSALLAGVAGILAAQHTMYISPSLLFWTVSGEALIVVILGGLGTLVGPLIGAVLFVFLKHEVSSHTDHWHMVIGLVLIATVLAGGRGIWGQIEFWLNGRRGTAGQAKEPSHA